MEDLTPVLDCEMRHPCDRRRRSLGVDRIVREQLSIVPIERGATPKTPSIE
jgi:hypothetical protein